MSELKRFGKSLRRLINSPKVFSLLHEGDWGTGGCWQLATALQEFMGPPAKLVALVSEGIVQHVLVQYVDIYIDYNGAQTAKELERNVANDPHYRGKVKLVNFTKKLQLETMSDGYIPCDIGIVKALRSELYRLFPA